MSEHWLSYVKRLHALASTGLFFGASDYDRERYAEIGEIAQTMLAELADVPVDRIPDLFPSYGKSYATPMIDVRGAVYRNDSVLLVQEKLDGLWTLPGGYADVGLSAAQNTIKEIEEEAGLQVAVTKLFAVRHKVKHAYAQDMRDFYKFFFLCHAADDAQPQPGMETSAAAFFPVHELPALSTGRVIAADIELGFQHLNNPQLPPSVD